MAELLKTNKKIQRVNALVDSYKTKLDNPYNIYINKSPVPVDWYNQCKEHTSLDETTREVWDYVGADSPIRYNLIKDAVVYGMSQMNVNLNIGDFGLTSDNMSGDTIVLPNTWVPYPNDYFRIQHIDKDLLFKVTSVTPDTFPNGANFYRVEFSYDKTSTDEINKQVVQTFRMILDNVGTEFNVIVKEDVFQTADNYDSIILALQNYYIQTFFKDSLQNFVYSYNGYNFYDPYMIEFLKRNSVLENSGGYIWINHELPLPYTFPMDYNRSVFRCLELNNINRSFHNRGVGKLIEDSYSIFYARTGEYYEVTYSNIQFAQSIDIMDGVLLHNIDSNTPNYSGNELYKNILVKYFNNDEFSDEEIQSLESLDIEDNKECFYYVPMVIYCLLQRFNTLIKSKE